MADIENFTEYKVVPLLWESDEDDNQLRLETKWYHKLPKRNAIVHAIKMVAALIFIVVFGVLAGWLVFTYTTLASMQIAIIVAVAVGATVSFSIGLFFIYLTLRKKESLVYRLKRFEESRSKQKLNELTGYFKTTG